jgi:Hydrolases of the alpha/beta superfamily
VLKEKTSAPKKAKKKKVLIAYYSRSGTTEKVAKRMQKLTGATLFRIQTKKKYPSNYDKLVKTGEKEQERQARPALKKKVKSMSSYDTVILGFPIWWDDAPMAVYTFLESHNLSGKTVLPFCTSGGSDISASVKHIRRVCKKSTVKKGLTANDVSNKKISSWLKKNRVSVKEQISVQLQIGKTNGDRLEKRSSRPGKDFWRAYEGGLESGAYQPLAGGKLAAIAVCGPFGAVKEQASGLYAQTMAERGFLTLAFDPSFTGESGGEPRYVASPDINTEDFQAAVASTMYDMTRVNARGYFDEEDSENARYEKRKALNAQRTEDYKNGSYAPAGGVADPMPEDAPFYFQDYHAYYKTDRGYHARSLNSNEGWNVTSSLSFLNMPILQYTAESRSAVLLIHGEKAHSCYFSRDAYRMLKGDNKELMIIPDTVHTDLYDNLDIIPFAKMECFFQENFK